MIIGLIDFEATGVDAKEARIIEIGLNAYASLLMRKAAFSYTTLVYEGTYPELTPEVEDVTGIKQSLLVKEGIPFTTMVGGLLEYVHNHQIEYFMAHNKSYDETLFKTEMLRNKPELIRLYPEAQLKALFDIPWLCSIEDIEHPEKFTCKKLSHLALDYGVKVDPSTLHRAMGDVTVLAALLDAGKIDFNKVVERFKDPWVYIKAMVPSPFGKGGDGGKGKEAAKKAGYGWQKAPRTDGPEFQNSWVKRVKEKDIQKEKEKLSGYEIRIVSK